MRTAILACLVITTAHALAAPASAEQGSNTPSPSPESTPDKPDTKTTKPNDKTADKEKKNATPESEVFIPSESISEDFAVSFPVDI